MSFKRPEECQDLSSPEPKKARLSEPKDELKNKQGVLDPDPFAPGPHDRLPYIYKLPPDHHARTHYLRWKCQFCGGAHPWTGCDLGNVCPLDYKLKDEDCVVVCFCGLRAVNGECPRNCKNNFGMGRAVLTKPKSRLIWLPFPKDWVW